MADSESEEDREHLLSRPEVDVNLMSWLILPEKSESRGRGAEVLCTNVATNRCWTSSWKCEIACQHPRLQVLQHPRLQVLHRSNGTRLLLLVLPHVASRADALPILLILGPIHSRFFIKTTAAQLMSAHCSTAKFACKSSNMCFMLNMHHMYIMNNMYNMCIMHNMHIMKFIYNM